MSGSDGEMEDVLRQFEAQAKRMKHDQRQQAKRDIEEAEGPRQPQPPAERAKGKQVHEPDRSPRYVQDGMAYIAVHQRREQPGVAASMSGRSLRMSEPLPCTNSSVIAPHR